MVVAVVRGPHGGDSGDGFVSISLKYFDTTICCHTYPPFPDPGLEELNVHLSCNPVFVVFRW